MTRGRALGTPPSGGAPSASVWEPGEPHAQEAEGSDPDDPGAASVCVAGRRCLQLLLRMQMRSETVHLPNTLLRRPRHPGPQPGGALSLLSSVTQRGLLLQSPVEVSRASVYPK